MTRDEMVRVFDRRRDAVARRDAERLAADHAMDGVLEYTFKDGLIAHERRVYDFTGMLVQIGLLKTRPA